MVVYLISKRYNTSIFRDGFGDRAKEMEFK
jgi:hypothetical protein